MRADKFLLAPANQHIKKKTFKLSDIANWSSNRQITDVLRSKISPERNTSSKFGPNDLLDLKEFATVQKNS